MQNLTPHQWQVLALLSAIGEPAGTEVIEKLCPVSRGMAEDSLQQLTQAGLVIRKEEGVFTLSDDMPGPLKSRLARMNSKKRVAALVATIRRLGIQDSFSDGARFTLLNKAGRDYDASLLAEESARRSVQNHRSPDALDLLNRTIPVIERHLGAPEWDKLFLSVVIELCRLRAYLISGIHEIPRLLKQARATAGHLGDRRTLARIDLISGLYLYVVGDSAGGLDLISTGLNKVDELGDEEMVAISSEFRAINFYLRGMYKEAVDAFDRVVRSGSISTLKSIPPFLPEHLASSSALGYCSALLGQYHRAIGVLDSHWRRSRLKKDDRNTPFYEALLGIVLIIMGRRNEAYTHLKEAQKEALEIGNQQALHVTRKGLAYHAYFEGRIEDAYWLTMNTTYTESIGPQYNWPVHLEMLYTFEKHDLLPPIPTLAFEQEMVQVLTGPNHHLRGVALRIRALQSQEKGEGREQALRLLLESEEELLLTGDPVELAKTRAEMARIKLAQQDRPAARNYALMAWEGLSGYGQDFFPDDLVPLLRIGTPPRPGPRKQDLIDRFMDLMDGFIPSADIDEILTRLVASTSRFFGAERGGFFWFPGGRESGRPLLRATYNLDKAEVSSESFRPSFGFIFKSFRNGEPLILKAASTKSAAESPGQTLSLFCLPITLRGQVRGVLYLDNSYIEDESQDIDRDVVVRMSRLLSTSLERIYHYAEIIEADRSRAVTMQSEGAGEDSRARIIGRSPLISSLLGLADQAAQSDATVLITGETGVGKELLARRIHDSSKRKEGPFVVVTLASIPETLVESELFGHEKGAFTGADRQKPGRVELAHMGTLFIDEIGDVPPSAQVKLLRVIQEKSFVRVGGIRTNASNFRLVAATNRDLAREIASGRFRQDLFFRLNVIPLIMPSLRDRDDDVVELAREFLRHYSRKYHRVLPALSTEDIKALKAYNWPGNVRELKNIMERSAILSSKEKLQLSLPRASAGMGEPGLPFTGTPTMEEVQRQYIKHVLQITHGRIGGPGGAAEILGMKRTTLQARMRKLGLSG
jgi:transcriptional regulator with GAF, ATPase, and Fis domain/tetratricopeptide (TPR) repeat protein